MRDDRLKWTAQPAEFAPISCDGVTVSVCDVGAQHLISGPRVEAGAGWPDMVAGAIYNLTVRRDMVLAVGTAPRNTGWDARRQEAVSDVSDGYRVFEISGPDSMKLLCRGAEIDIDLPSASVARMMWGMSIMLYRFEDASTFRLHAERGYALALHQALCSAAAYLDNDH